MFSRTFLVKEKLSEDKDKLEINVCYFFGFRKLAKRCTKMWCGRINFFVMDQVLLWGKLINFAKIFRKVEDFFLLVFMYDFVTFYWKKTDIISGMKSSGVSWMDEEFFFKECKKMGLGSNCLANLGLSWFLEVKGGHLMVYF